MGRQEKGHRANPPPGGMGGKLNFDIDRGKEGGAACFIWGVGRKKSRC